MRFRVFYWARRKGNGSERKMAVMTKDGDGFSCGFLPVEGKIDDDSFIDDG